MINNYTPYLFDFQEIYDIDTETMQLFQKSREISKKFPEILLAIDEDLKIHGLDDFSRIYIDSTHVAANTSYPTDVSILYKLLDRAYRSFNLLKDFGFPALESWIGTRQLRMKKHLSFISMNVGKNGVKGKVKERFKLMMRMADENIKCFLKLQQDFKEQWENSDLPPDKGIALEN